MSDKPNLYLIIKFTRHSPSMIIQFTDMGDRGNFADHCERFLFSHQFLDTTQDIHALASPPDHAAEPRRSGVHGDAGPHHAEP